MKSNLSIDSIFLLPSYFVSIPGLLDGPATSFPLKNKDYKTGHIKAILFDLDMTLVDTSTLKKMRSERKWDEVYKNIPSTKIIVDKDFILHDIMMDICKGIITSSPRKYAELVCNYHNIQAPILTAYHDTKRHKPDTEPIYHACNQLNLKPSDIAYVGDSVSDMHAILEAGGTGIHFISDQDALNEACNIFKSHLNNQYTYKCQSCRESCDQNVNCNYEYTYSRYYIINNLETILESFLD